VRFASNGLHPYKHTKGPLGLFYEASNEMEKKHLLPELDAELLTLVLFESPATPHHY
jgi:hypothetical protein